MTGTMPGPDEQAVSERLRKLGVGPDAQPAPTVPAPTRTRDWLDDILEDNATPPARRPAPATKEEKPEQAAPRERRDWSWLWLWLSPWQTLTAGAVSVLPLFNGWSLATGWARVLHDMRADTISGAYTTAGVVLVLAYALDLRRRRWVLRLALITAVVGSLGVFDWFDPITLVTGVHR